MKGKIALLITIAALIYTLNLKNKGDHEPWCNFPHSYPPSMQTVDMQVDVQKYLGTWYEILHKGGAAFQGKCICSQAVYGFDQEKKRITVDNSCIDKDHKKEETKGYAYPDNTHNTKLQVYFNPVIAGNYWILALDEQYGHALVGEPCKKMLWILSREKTLPKATTDSLLQIAKGQGYDIDHGLKYRDPSC